MRTGAVSQEQEQVARNRVETYVRAMFAIKGLGQPDPQHMLPMISRAVSLLSTDQVRNPDKISPESLGDIQAAVFAQPPPANAYGANAPGSEKDSEGIGKSSAKAIEVLERLRNGATSVREAADGAIHADRGARFDDMNTMDWGSPGGLAKMRDLAIQKGLPWAANNTELLRLGPAAIGALADVHFKQEAYKRLTTDASFKAKEIVTLARFAKREHLDANHLAGVMSHGVKKLAGDDIPARRRLDTAFAGYMDHPKRPETKQRLFKTLNPYADDPSKKPEVYKMLEAVKIKREEFDASRSAENPTGIRRTSSKSRRP